MRNLCQAPESVIIPLIIPPQLGTDRQQFAEFDIALAGFQRLQGVAMNAAALGQSGRTELPGFTGAADLAAEGEK